MNKKELRNLLEKFICAMFILFGFIQFMANFRKAVALSPINLMLTLSGALMLALGVVALISGMSFSVRRSLTIITVIFAASGFLLSLFSEGKPQWTSLEMAVLGFLFLQILLKQQKEADAAGGAGK